MRKTFNFDNQKKKEFKIIFALRAVHSFLKDPKYGDFLISIIQATILFKVNRHMTTKKALSGDVKCDFMRRRQMQAKVGVVLRVTTTGIWWSVKLESTVPDGPDGIVFLQSIV
jgi:hypothetical protein